MSDVAYWRARLRALQARLQEHYDAVPSEPGDGSPEYRRGYDAGRRTAYLRGMAMIGQLAREWAAETAREAGREAPSPEGPPRGPQRVVRPRA